MKVKVMRKFRDRHTGTIYKRGEVLEITEARYAEIMSVGRYVFKFAENEPVGRTNKNTVNTSGEAEKPVKRAAALSGDGFDAMSVRELKEYADKAHKLTFGRGTKRAEMIETLRNIERNK